MESRQVEVVRGQIRNFFNAHNPDAAADYFTQDTRFHGGSLGDRQGLEAHKTALAGFFEAFPDVRATEQGYVEGGDAVAMRFVVEGTHRGDLPGIPATGRRARWDANMIYRFADNKISEQWAIEDWVAVFRDLGVFEPPF